MILWKYVQRLYEQSVSNSDVAKKLILARIWSRKVSRPGNEKRRFFFYPQHSKNIFQQIGIKIKRAVNLKYFLTIILIKHDLYLVLCKGKYSSLNYIMLLPSKGLHLSDLKYAAKLGLADILSWRPSVKVWYPAPSMCLETDFLLLSIHVVRLNPHRSVSCQQQI